MALRWKAYHGCAAGTRTTERRLWRSWAKGFCCVSDWTAPVQPDWIKKRSCICSGCPVRVRCRRCGREQPSCCELRRWGEAWKTHKSGTFDDFNGLLDPYKLFGLDNDIRDRLASADAHFKRRFLGVSSDVRPREVTQDQRRTRPLSVSWKTTQTHPPSRCIRPLPAIVSENRSAFLENSPFMLGVRREEAIQAFRWRPPGDECKLDAWFGGSHQRAAAPARLCLVRFWGRKEAYLYIQVLFIFIQVRNASVKYWWETLWNGRWCNPFMFPVNKCFNVTPEKVVLYLKPKLPFCPLLAIYSQLLINMNVYAWLWASGLLKWWILGSMLLRKHINELNINIIARINQYWHLLKLLFAQGHVKVFLLKFMTD